MKLGVAFYPWRCFIKVFVIIFLIINTTHHNHQEYHSFHCCMHSVVVCNRSASELPKDERWRKRKKYMSEKDAKNVGNAKSIRPSSPLKTSCACLWSENAKESELTRATGRLNMGLTLDRRGCFYHIFYLYVYVRNS